MSFFLLPLIWLSFFYSSIGAINPKDKYQLGQELVSAAYEGNKEAIATIIKNIQNPTLKKEILNTQVSASSILKKPSNLTINALMTAIIAGHKDIVDDLITTKLIDVNAKAGGTGATALMFAVDARLNSVEMMKSLLQDPMIDINAIDNNGNTALMHAVMQNKDELLDLLLEKNPNLNICNNNNQTALDISIDNHNANISLILKDKGVITCTEIQALAKISTEDLQKQVKDLTKALDTLIKQLP